MRAASAVAALGFAATSHAGPVVTCENFNELGNVYQATLNNTALTGLPTGISANFNWHCQLMWSPGVNPPNSMATNNVEVGWTPATPAVTFSKPVVLWSVESFKKWSNPLTLTGRRNGLQVWAYTNSDTADNAWVTVTRGAGKNIDELDVSCDPWGVKLTDFRLSDATGISPFTNVSPYYVDGGNALANDYNAGTEAQPWKTIQWAANALQAGDTVYIKAGTYAGTVTAVNSGSAQGWITYSAYPGQEQKAVINGGTFQVFQKSYIRITGLKIQHVVGGGGIYVVGPGGNYNISGNYIYDTSESGIAVWGVPWQSDPGIYNFKAITNVIVANNTIEMACNGGWNEQLDIANGVDGFDLRNNILKNGTNAINGGEGIDCKAGASNGKIRGNQLFNLRRYAIYLEAGACEPAYYATPGLLTNIEVYDNVIHNNDSHGLGLTSEGLGNIDGIKIYNNICYSNGADGILLYDYGYTSAENYARNITILNNTTYNNNTSTNMPWYGGIATDHKYAQNVVVRNNISYETLHYAFAIKQPSNPATVMDHNLGTATNPGFVNVAKPDFHLKPGSAAIDAGSPTSAPSLDYDGSARPHGGRFDLGAFEYAPASPFFLSVRCLPGQSNPSITLQGGPESHYRVEQASALINGAWTLLQDVPSLPYSPYTFSDTNAVSGAPQRFYRAVLLVP